MTSLKIRREAFMKLVLKCHKLYSVVSTLYYYCSIIVVVPFCLRRPGTVATITDLSTAVPNYYSVVRGSIAS